MIKIYTRKNYLAKDDKKPFLIRSSTLKVMDEDTLVKRMQQYNSTITEADMKAVLSVFRTIVLRAAGEGYMVRIPIGSIWPVASGSCQTQDDPYEPGKNGTDHDLELHFKASSSAKAEFIAGADCDRVSSRFIQTPAVIGGYYLDDGGDEYPIVKRDAAGAEISSITLHAGDTLRLRGDYIKVTASDEEQGIFLVNQETAVRTRIAKYTHNGASIVDGTLPADIAAGTYRAELTTQPGTDRYATAKSPDRVVIG